MDSKPIWQSKTLWGMVITILGIAFPKLKSAFGSPAEQDALISTVLEASGLIITLVGRLLATATLTVKK